MSETEIIVKMDKHIKIKGGHYVQDLVRCKDCKHNFTKSWNQGKRDNPICHFTDFRRPNEFYCEFGERADI